LSEKAQALAGLGRIEDLNRLVDEIMALPEQDLDKGYRIRRIAVFLRCLGYADVARSTIDRAVEWYESRPIEVKATTAWRYRNAQALYVADRCDEAYSVAEPLLDEAPENIEYRGFVGSVAACRGDQDTALAMSRWLAALDRPYLHGENTVWRSAIAAALGDGETAVTLWRQAAAEGSFPLITVGDIRWIAFEPICDYEPWQELIRPKG